MVRAAPAAIVVAAFILGMAIVIYLVLLRRGRLVLVRVRLRDGDLLQVTAPEAVQVRRGRDTITIPTSGGVREIFFQDLLAVEWRPRSAAVILRILSG